MRIAVLSNVTTEVLAGMLRKEHDVWLPPGFGAWMETALAPSPDLVTFNPEAVFLLLDSSFAPFDAEGVASAKAALERELPAAAVIVPDLADLADATGGFTDERMWKLASMPWSLKGLRAIVDEIDRLLRIMREGAPKKALALDLDNTLWGGVVGDDGVEGIRIGQETGEAQSYYEFQSYIKSLKDLGIILTVCSKNDHENAIAGLNHPEGALKPDDFIIIKANWENKDRNIVETAAELNILPDSIVFVDDNPAERAIVSAQIPGISAPEMDSVENYIMTLDSNGFFEVTTFNEDDLKRNEMYKANAQRAAQQATFADYKDYLLSLDMTAVIDDFIPVYLQRITQLSNKSNQFNVTTKRYTPTEMEAVYESGDYIRLYGKLVDKFGDNGVVSVVIGKKDAEDASVLNMELWLMSCRVLKRDMELAMLDRLVERCKAQGIKTIKGYYYPTAKNNMVRELYGFFGFTKISEDEAGNTVWTLDVDSYENRNHVIRVEDNSALK